jgi:AcrR family transcriptional regulator
MSPESVATDEILDGVYGALCTHGYADLTMQDIADECEKSTSLLHYHYDTKAELMIAFLDHIITNYEERLAEETAEPPERRLVTFLARFVFEPGDDERQSFHLALLEMRSQGPFDERIRKKLESSDAVLRGTAADILRDGIEAGVFEDVDPDRTAAMLVAALDGARTRQITLGEGQPADTYTRVVIEELLSQVVEPILADSVEMPPLADVLADLSGENEE